MIENSEMYNIAAGTRRDEEMTGVDSDEKSEGIEMQGNVSPALEEKKIVQEQTSAPEEGVGQLRQRALEHLGAHRWLQAGEIFSELLTHDKKDEEALLGLAQALDRIDHYELLYETALHVLENNSSSAQGLAFKARALQKLERLSEATIANDQALLLDTHLSLAWINRSGLQLLQQKFPEALRSAQRATELAPDDERAWANRGVALLNFSHPLEAMTMFDRALALDPKHLFSLQMKSEILCKLGRMSDAIPVIRHALSIDPHNVIVLTQGVQALRALEQHNSMQELAKELTTLTPDSLFAWESYMRGLRGVGHYEEALPVLDRVLELDTANVRFWTLKADTLYRLERYRESAKVAEHAVRLYSGYPPAHRIREKAVRMMYQRKDKKKS
jgi:tetratricopeptide (TPR) repeat protein